MATAVEQARIIDQPEDQYHADHSRLSKSMLFDFINRRRVYEAKYVLHNAPLDESTAAMDIGTLADAALLEPDRLPNLYRIYPADALAKNGATNTNACRDFQAECAELGATPVKQATFDVIQAMVESAKRKLGDWLYLPNQKRQATVQWTNEETGLPCRCRPDWMILPKSDVTIVFDLKTTADSSPGAFRYRCKDNGYAYQQVHYSEGIAAATGRRVEFYFFVVETKWPFECAIYQLSEQTVEAAAEARLTAMRQIVECRKTGDYREPWADAISVIDLHPSTFSIAS